MSQTALPQTPAEARALIRSGAWTGPTSGLAMGYVQANLVIVPKEYAFDFLRFCVRNPKPCPLLEVTESGSPEPVNVAPGADLRTDLPRHRVLRHGAVVDETPDLSADWRPDLVAFLLGCSFTFEAALLRAGVPLRHIECGCTVSMYITNRECKPAGPFSGPLVVSMRPIPADKVARAVQTTAQYPLAHGSPVHVGDPAGLGIADLSRPDFGDSVEIRPGEVPVFWAWGVTPQLVTARARPDLATPPYPAHLFLTHLPEAGVRAL